MKKALLFMIGFLLLFASCIVYAQHSALSTGKAPYDKTHINAHYGTSPLASVAFANDNETGTNVSFPVPDGTPFTNLGSFAAPNFASSMCKGPYGNYYLIDIAPALYLFDPDSGTCTLIGNITGMNGEQPNGISYDPVNNSFYMVSDYAFYSLDIPFLTATLIGYFTPAISGLMVDLCFDENGVCYAYEVNTNVGAANAYIIDISTGALTTLGYVGFTPDYGQGMSYDFETGTIYLTAFNYDSYTCQLRTMDKSSGMTTLVHDWGFDQLAAFALDTQYGPPCPVSAAGNPDPPTGTGNVSVDGTTLTWDNSPGTTNIELWFGPVGNVSLVHRGTPITSWDTGELEYNTTYFWFVINTNDTCGTTSSEWTFTTEQNPNLVVQDFYPMNVQYWTGTTDGTTKTDGQINTDWPNVGWAAFDISGIPQFSQIQEITFYGFVCETNIPSWSATPMAGINPVTDDPAAIRNQILSTYGESIAYIYSDEPPSFYLGWHHYLMGNAAATDLMGAVDAGQGWFATGFIDRDFKFFYLIDFFGWSQPHPPYLEISYVPTPVEMASFRADVNEGTVVLNWQTATETNNKGFEIQRQGAKRKEHSGEVSWENIGFVEGSGTSTETHSYSYTDKNVVSGKYYYRLKQTDFDGISKYSGEVQVEVNLPSEFSLRQNYPNPFNPTTMIQYSIPEDQHVRLNVYNLLGEKVETLVDGFQKAGQHEINFNASTNGVRIASGIYFYKLEAGEHTSVKKMILMK